MRSAPSSTWTRLVLAATLSLAPGAHAQDPPHEAPDAVPAPTPAPATARAEQIYATQQSYLISPSSKVTRSLLMPTGYLELGGELVFVTSRPAPERAAIDFTDLGLLRVRGRSSVIDWLELFAMTQLLIKQPNATDDPVWQGALAGARAGFAEHFALGAEASVGPLFGTPGLYASAGPGLFAKASIDRMFHFELGLGHAFTVLLPESVSERSFYLHEVVMQAEAQLGAYSGAFIVGCEYRLPFASGPDRGGGSASALPADHLDPTPQLSFQIGGVLRAGSDEAWDLFALFEIIDRGELGDPATTLPILDGGFDQHQWQIGVQYRFGAERARR